MISISRDQAKRETAYTVGTRRFVLKDMTFGIQRIVAQELLRLLNEAKVDVVAAFSGKASGQAFLDAHARVAGFIAGAWNAIFRLDGSDVVTATWVDENFDNADIMECSRRIVADNKLDPVVEVGRSFVVPFFRASLGDAIRSTAEKATGGESSTSITPS